MDWFRILLSRFAALFRRHKLDTDLDEELRAHIELAIAENLQHGMDAQEARTAALRAFGGVTQTRESYRIQRGMPVLAHFSRDLRFAFRQLRKSPGFTLTAVLTLALGLGANIAVFSLINCILLRPLPVPHADELAVLRIDRSDDTSDGPDYIFCAPFLRALEKRHQAFQSLASFSTRPFQVRAASGNVEVSGALVSGQFFQVLETPPLLGRWLTPQDDLSGTATTAVISESFWRTWFNRDSNVIGRSLTIANMTFTIVGVMPAQFIGSDPTKRPEIFVPTQAEPVIDAPFDAIAASYHSRWLRIIARRNPGISLGQANAALLAASNPILDESIPDARWIKNARDHHFRFAAEPGSRGYAYLRATFRKPLLAVFVLCSAMLVLACLNLASLLMARAAARERELATRLAMGASRIRLVQQLLVESLLIALAGTAAGLLAAPAVSRALGTMLIGHNRGTFLDTSLDMRVLVFVVLTAIVCTVVIGLLPTLRATSRSLNEQIKSGSHFIHAHRHSLLPRLLMGLQVALALILVFGAGLLATSLHRLHSINLGFQPKGLVNLNLEMNKQSRDGEALVAWYRDYADALSHLPGVKAVGYASITPMSGGFWISDLRTALSGGDRKIYMNVISPSLFSTMGIPILSGRDFAWSDTTASGLKIILNQGAASLLFPGRNAVGQTVTIDKKNYLVIAVVGDIHYTSLRRSAPAGAYLPFTQISQGDEHKPDYTAVVRIEGSAAPLAAAARQIAAKMAPDVPAPVITAMSADIDGTIASERIMASLAIFFAICALLVTAIGLYGTLAYTTARRTSEIGIRIALGAQRVQVVGLVFRENALIAATGSLIGLIVALLAARSLASFLYSTSAQNPGVMLGSVAALFAIASAASLVPAIRAARIEPITALRAD